MEFGGKLFDDFHASRVLPGFQPDSKLKMLMQLSNYAEIVIVISAIDIENNKVRDDLGITYDKDVFRLKDEFEKCGLMVSSVVITHYKGQTGAKLFRNRLKRANIKTYLHYTIEGYPSNVALIDSDEGFGKNEYVETTRPLVVVTAPGPGSGKMAVCLSQLYQDNKKGIKAGYAKFETFPIWNLPLKHSVNLAYEAWTPISSFYANYDGNNKKISNLKISSSSSNVGLFSDLQPGSTVQNLSIENCDIQGNYSVGGLAGTAYKGDITINNVSVTGTIKGYNSIGGLIGNLDLNTYEDSSEFPPITITNSWVKATIDCNSDYVGGLIGRCSGYDCYAGPPTYLVLNKCFSDSIITVINTYEWSYAGGLLSDLEQVDIEMKYCYSKGVLNNGGREGGLIGYVSCYTNRIHSTIEQCYSAMTINGGSAVGSFFGQFEGYINVTDCFTTCTEDYPLYQEGYFYDSISCFYNLPDGYVAGKDWTNGPTTWEDSGAWETPIASYPKLVGVGGQD